MHDRPLPVDGRGIGTDKTGVLPEKGAVGRQQIRLARVYGDLRQELIGRSDRVLRVRLQGLEGLHVGRRIPPSATTVAEQALLQKLRFGGLGDLARQIQPAIGGGGLGDLAIRYGYERFDLNIMIITIVILLVLVQAIQSAGDALVRRVTH